MDYPHCDVAFISGCVRTQENIASAKQIRQRAKTVVALGSCAVYGGIPALANLSTNEQIYHVYYGEQNNNQNSQLPKLTEEELLDRAYALNEIIEVDLALPGCAPSPANIAKAVLSLVKGQPYKYEEKSVCDTCPLERKSKWGMDARRSLESAKFIPGDYDKTRCLAEQGHLCLGPVTRGGCAERLDGGKEIPGCIQAFMGCRGCYGPVHKYTNTMAGMLGALATVGSDITAIPDKKALFNRFTGANGNLRPEERGEIK
jgi:F420-non-reducing hydrogenase small subunit